ncbi:hypothetical protein LL037_18890 [Clostridium estertheticum]|uniref:hypothetical protein n=1 Tax=Clostridium estertheticum TaxID=238834 RepID=UPI001C0B75B5|nr:hypothetical protein [Clostridium estertheticum]MBU3198537.1 hypothetical protein [Clostridium estertheticum]WAG64515.1 hypothetical protein LL037_18890 [Clostridium estertheticum]
MNKQNSILISSNKLYKKVALLVDDLKSHLRATTLYMALIELMKSRGIKITDTYQLNFGGNMDFYNLTSFGRSLSKQKSKRNALFVVVIDASRVAAGTNAYVEYLGDTKICYLHLECISILNSKIIMKMKYRFRIVQMQQVLL